MPAHKKVHAMDKCWMLEAKKKQVSLKAILWKQRKRPNLFDNNKTFKENSFCSVIKNIFPSITSALF